MASAAVGSHGQRALCQRGCGIRAQYEETTPRGLAEHVRDKMLSKSG